LSPFDITSQLSLFSDPSFVSSMVIPPRLAVYNKKEDTAACYVLKNGIHSSRLTCCDDVYS